MTFAKMCKINISLIAMMTCAFPAFAVFQTAWDNPNANMISGSSQPGYANLAWSTGTVLPIKTRAGMATMVNLPMGEKIADAVEGSQGLFDIKAERGDQVLYITPSADNQGNDTNLIVLVKENVTHMCDFLFLLYWILWWNASVYIIVFKRFIEDCF